MRLSLKAKVLSLAVVPVLLFAVVISLTTVWILQGQARNEVDETRQRLLNDAKTTLQSYVEVAMTTIKPLYDAAAPGDTAARAEVVKLLSNTSYGKDGYFFGYDSETIRLFKGNSPDGVGKSFKDNRDPNGVYVNRDWSRSARTVATTCNTVRPSPARPSWCPRWATPNTCPSGTWSSVPR